MGYTTLQESEALRKPQVHTILHREQSREKYHCLANLCTILLMHPLGSPWCIILQGNAPLKELLVKRGVTPIVKAEGTWEELKNTPIKGRGGGRRRGSRKPLVHHITGKCFDGVCHSIGYLYTILKRSASRCTIYLGNAPLNETAGMEGANPWVNPKPYKRVLNKPSRQFESEKRQASIR